MSTLLSTPFAERDSDTSRSCRQASCRLPPRHIGIMNPYTRRTNTKAAATKGSESDRPVPVPGAHAYRCEQHRGENIAIMPIHYETEYERDLGIGERIDLAYGALFIDATLTGPPSLAITLYRKTSMRPHTNRPTTMENQQNDTDPNP